MTVGMRGRAGIEPAKVVQVRRSIPASTWTIAYRGCPPPTVISCPGGVGRVLPVS